MDPKDIKFTLKTGSDDYPINQTDEEDDINIIEILSIVTTFSQNSIGSASTYSKYVVPSLYGKRSNGKTKYFFSV